MAFIYDLTDTWNAGGTTFNAIKMNVTDTASAAASKLITVQVGGSEKFSVKKDGVGYFAGNVGIGTSSPANQLHISGTAPIIRLTDTTTGANAGILADNATGSLSISTDFSNTVGGSIINFLVDNTERMRITSSGNVGIGTSSPSQKLTVAGNIELFQGADRFIKLGSSTNYNYTLSAVGDDFQILEAGTTPRLTIKYPNGNVGIGTTSPGVALDVFSAAGPIIKSRSSTVSTTLRGFEIQTGNDIHAAFKSEPSSGELRIAAGFSTWGGYQTFYTNGSERARIDSSGNLLVGTTTTTATNSRSYVFDKANGRSYIQHDTSNVTGDYYYLFFYNGGAIGSITQIGTTGVLYNTSSDARLKENIAPADDAAALIDAIQVRKFDWKADGSHQRYGMVAQELLEVAPEAVSGEPEGEDMMGVDYSKLVPMLIKEIQSLRARVAQLEG